MEWEGAYELNLPSLRAKIGSKVNQLRDPYIFVDDDEQLYLLYTGGGGQAIGIAKLSKK